LEVLLASIIFMISVLGVFATLSAVRQPVLQKERALTAAVFTQQLLEGLRSQVSASNFTANGYNGSLSLGSHGPVSQNQDGVQYNMTYVVSCAANGSTSGPCPADTAMTVNATVAFPDAT